MAARGHTDTGIGASIRRILHGAVAFDRSAVDPIRGLRYAIGVGIPLLAGIAAGRTIEGVAASLGALLVGLTDSGAPYRSRIGVMLIASVAVAVSTFVGQVVGGHDVAATAVLTAASFGAGMFAAFGMPTYIVALMCPAAVVAAEALPASPGPALGRAVLALAGGLLEIALVLVVWRIEPRRPQRMAIAHMYRELARWATDTSGADDRGPVYLAQQGARETLDRATGRAGLVDAADEALRVLIDQADRALTELVALRNARQWLDARSLAPAAVTAIAAARRAAAEAFTEIAEALETRRWRADAAAVGRGLRGPAEAIAAELPDADESGAKQLQAALGRAEALQAVVRGAVALTASWLSEPTPAGPVGPVARQRRRRVRATLTVLRANLTLRSSALRHAIRLGATVLVADALQRALDLPHGYWVPLTVVWMLRPDFGSTFTRGVQRYLGTAVGAVLATLFASAVAPGPYALAVLATALAVGIFVFLRANYALACASITGFVVFVSALGGIPEVGAAADRLLDTALGASLTLAFYALWPTWERATLASTIAEGIDESRRYVDAVLAWWLDPTPARRRTIELTRAGARVTRTNVEAAVHRALSEPGHGGGFGTSAAAGLLANMRRLADGAVALEADRPDTPRGAAPEARTLARELDRTMVELAAAARERRPPQTGAALRRAHQQLSRAAGPTAPLVTETDRMVDSALLAADVLRGAAETAAAGSTSTPVTSAPPAVSSG
jgi:uncharacterized membrane protein YccC